MCEFWEFVKCVVVLERGEVLVFPKYFGEQISILIISYAPAFLPPSILSVRHATVDKSLISLAQKSPRIV